jgi:hypothetical protein
MVAIVVDGDLVLSIQVMCQARNIDISIYKSDSYAEIAQVGCAAVGRRLLHIADAEAHSLCIAI